MGYMEKCFRKSSAIVDRVIDDEVILVPVSSKLSSQGSIYNLDIVGARIWQWIDGKNTVAHIKQRMVETMDVSSQRAEIDLMAFLKDLESVGAIEEVKQG